MAEFTLEPVEGDSYEGRQISWTILCDGQPYMRVSTGGTGDCWNLYDLGFGFAEDRQVHVCDLGDFVEALTVLRDSTAHADHVARWV